MLELTVERYLVAQATRRGGIALKHGVQGWPDRIVILPGGKVGWCEVKRPGQLLRVLQAARMKVLQALGCVCGMCDTLSSVDAFMVALEGKQCARILSVEDEGKECTRIDSAREHEGKRT